MIKYSETPLIKLKSTLETEAKKISLYIKREDLNHEFVSGNKWWKLKDNLLEAKKLGHDTLLTFGGALSNHIYATAAAAREMNLKSIGIIRGEETLPLNETLAFAKSCGMILHYVSREDYKKKAEESFIEKLKEKFGDFYLIPEGGTNLLAVKSCAEFAREKLLQIDFDYMCLPVGTGGTMAGIICGLEGKKKIIGFSVLKNGEFLNEEVKKFIEEVSDTYLLRCIGVGHLETIPIAIGTNWHIETNYHFGGYAKRTKELDQFILQMKQQHDLPLEFVYSAKMAFGVFDLISKNYFPEGAKILMLHTGGLKQVNHKVY